MTIRYGLRRLLREPLLHFVILGGALFLLFSWPAGDPTSEDSANRIAITPGLVQHLAAGFERTWQRPPSQSELDNLVEEYIREEIYYREALALGLDRDDAIVRRRLTQKLEFLSAEAVDLLQPSEAELQDYLRAHRETYLSEPQYSLRQVYVSQDRRGREAREYAESLLQRLNAGDFTDQQAATLGDPLMLPHAVPESSRSMIARRFGEDFADQLAMLDKGRWVGPVESGYGLHLVFISRRSESRLPDLQEIRSEVLRDWLDERRRQHAEDYYRTLRSRYRVVIEWPETGTSSGRAEPTEQVVN